MARPKKAKHPICQKCGREMIWTGGVLFSWFCFVCGEWKQDFHAWPEASKEE